MDYLYSLQTLRESCPEFVNMVLLVISEFIAKAGIIIPAGIYWCLSKRAGAYIMSCYTGGYMLNQVIKNTACVYRPWVSDPRLHVSELAAGSATGYSFPSGHTICASTIYGGTAIYKAEKKWFVLLMAVMIVLTAFSRNWLGAHTLADVAVAILEGLIVLLINACIVNAITGRTETDKELHPERDIIFFGLGIVFIAVAMFWLRTKSYPVDFDSNGMILADPWEMMTDCYTGAGMFGGFLLGWIIERRFIGFSIEGTAKQKTIRFMAGTVTLLALYLGILPMVLKGVDAHTSHLIKYFLVFFYVMAVYPFIVKKIEGRNAAAELA